MRKPGPAARATSRYGTGSVQTGWSDDGRTMAMRKSMPPAVAGALADVAEVQWVGLHDRQTAPMLADVPGLDIVDPSPWITDLADTAAAIANLDLVLTVDTAVAHLAGAMGKPVWLMLWRNPDWRWGPEREDSYWYPNVRVFRQSVAGDWAGVLNAVVRALG